MLESVKLRVRQVSLGHRKIGSELTNEHLEELLENGRNLRKSNAYPIECRVMLNHVWKMSKKQIETINRNRKRIQHEGTLPPSVPVEVINPYQSHPDFYSAIIPHDGITRAGYVKEIWIQSHTSELVEIGNQSYNIIDPYAHDTEQWIQGFILYPDNLVKLLPSQKIVVKYFHRSE